MKNHELSAQKWIEKGRKVWVKATNQFHNPNEDAFLQGQIVDIQNSKHARILLSQSKQQFKIPFQACLKLTYGAKDVADMVDLQQLNEPQLLYNIKRRYVDDSIFTYCGPTLLIINPYTKIEKLFNDNVLQQYQSHVFTDTLQYKTLTPHIFGLAAFCLWQLFDNERNQSIVISGQSGAGKTQNTKYCLKFLASLGKNMKQLINESHSLKKSKMNNNLRAAERAVKKTSSKVYGIEQKILGCNEILQAFGNSKTIRNDNSSRFGKLILLVYGQTQIQIKSAFIISYLLQKSRIVSVSQGQRNYHIFYYLIKGTSQQQKKKFHLKSKVSDYYYLNQSSVTTISGVSDEERFEEIKRQFQLYLNKDQIQSVLKILSAVLNLGNITFKKVQTANTGQSAVVENPEYLKVISELLNVPDSDLEHSFKFKTRKMGVSIIDSPLRYQQAISLRDSFAKNIYEKIFNFLIKKMNQKIQIEQISLDEQKGSNNYRKSIGLLDIFGFEVLNTNSLQQFFINFANEKLQQLYVSYIFKQEQNEFMKQGLREFSHDIGFQDNKPIIDLFENYPLGVFHLINQSSELNQDDKDLPSSIEKNHGKNVFLKIPKAKRSCFEILHSCSPVSYSTTGFTIKNKDQFPQQLLSVLGKTKSQDILKICIGQQAKQKEQANFKAGRKAAKKFLGSKFLNSMNTLIEQLYSCDCHFVRCIKPNSKKSPKLFNSEAVLQSLRYLGVLDSIIIRKLGYIYRRPFKQFYKKFYQLDNYNFSFHQDVNKLKTQDDFKKECQKIISKYMQKQFEDNNILLGHKKILIKESTLNHLQLLTKEKRKLRISGANRFKTMYKNAIFRTKVKLFLKSLRVLKIHMQMIASDVKEKILNGKVIKIQNVVKKFLWQKRLEKIKEQATKSVTKISAYFKMKRQRKIYLLTKQRITSIQSNTRLFLTMGRIFKHRFCQKTVRQLYENSWKIIQNRRAILLQKVWKGYQVRKKYKKAIETMKKNLRLSKIKAKFKRAIFKHNYNKFHEALNRYKRPIIKLQAIVRGKFLHRVFNLVKSNTVLIQRAYRRHLKKKFYLSRQWQQYKLVIQQNQRVKLAEMRKIGYEIPKSNKLRHIDETNGLSRTIYPNELIQNYAFENLNNKLQESQPKQGFDVGINETLDFGDKNTLQLYMIDYDSVSVNNTQIESSFIGRYEKIKSVLRNKGQYITFIDLTENYLVVVSNKDKIYRVHDSGNIEIQQAYQISYLHKISSSHKGSVIFQEQQSKPYQWGLMKDKKSFKQTDKSYNFIQSSKRQIVINYVAKGETQFIIYESQVHQKTTLFGKQQVEIHNLPHKISVTQVAASYHFVHFLGNNGNVYSKGANIRGQLGFGFKSAEIKTLTVNYQLQKFKQHIESIAVGFGHTVAKSKLGYVYVWGDNSYGQINDVDSHSCRPRKIQHESKPLKVYQVAAGLKASYFLTQSLKVLACGASLGFSTQTNQNLVELTLLQQINFRAKFLHFIKLRCVWNSSYSILFANTIDVSKCKQGAKSDAILKYTKSIAKQWIQNTVYPVYHEFIDNCLNLSDLELKFKQKNDKTQNERRKIDKLTRVEELKMILDLRKTSSMFRQAARVKVQEFLGYLNHKKEENWNNEEKEMHSLIMNEFKSSSR